MAHYAKVITDNNISGIGSTITDNVVSEIIVADASFFNDFVDTVPAVSYTHLTLPTNREV